MDKKTMLFLSGDSWPVVYQFLTKAFNYHMVQRGWEITWVFPCSDIEDVTKTDWNGSEVYLIPKMHKKGLIGNITSVLFTIRNLCRVLNKINVSKYDIIWVRDEPIMSFFAAYAKFIYKKRLCFQLSHFKAEELIIRGKETKSVADCVKGNIGKLIINVMMKYHDRIFAISNQMKLSLISWYNMNPERIIALPEGVDTYSDIDKVQNMKQQIREEVRSKYGLSQNDIVLIYAGTLNKFRKLDILIGMIAEVNKEMNAFLFIVGGSIDGEDIESLKTTARSMGVLNKCIFTGFVPQDTVIDYLLASDIGISPFQPNKVLINNSPIKILEYWNAGLPVVASNIPEQSYLINQCGGGLLVEHNLDDYVIAIKQLSQNKAEMLYCAKQGREYVINNRDFGVLAEILDSELQRIITTT